MRSRRTLIGCVAVMALCASNFSAPPPVQTPAAPEILSKLRSGHPRLLANSNDFAQLNLRIAADPLLQSWRDKLTAEAERLLSEPPSQYEIPDGLRLLATSRRVLHRVRLLALLYQLDRDHRWRDRAWKELDTAAQFKDWNPRHFLDTAEMTQAFAIGYDWLYDGLNPDQRAALRTSIVEKGIKLANQIHREKRWWAVARHNWNQVCNGGIGVGALAIADEEPAVAGEFLEAALRSIQLAMTEFAPDGAWAEGPGYWNYATSYNVAFLAALQSALGTDFGLSEIQGFSHAGDFPLYLTGPLKRTFNYADGGDGAIRAAQMFWFARQFHNPAYAAYEKRLASPDALDLLWFDPKLASASATELPLDKYFRGAEIVALRSAWDDPNALFVGFKAGDNKANHSHLDLGSFVFDALGKRWAIDMGADDYNLPNYFGKDRWNYYRLRAEGQNSLVLNPSATPDQDPKAAAKIERFESTPARSFAIANLTAAYANHAQSVRRGLALLDRKSLLIQDEVTADKPIDTWWFMHTPAQIQIGADGRTATLKQGDATLHAQLISPADARFYMLAAAPLPTSPHPAKQNQNKGIAKLTIHIPQTKDLRLTVLLAPGAPALNSPPQQQPLANW